MTGINHCPVMEQTAEGIQVGRCWMFLENGRTCSRHGDVAEAIQYYKQNNKLILEEKLSENNRKQNDE